MVSSLQVFRQNFVCTSNSLMVLGIFLFTTASRTALGPTQPPIQWVPRVLSLGVKQPGREADHSLPSSAEVKECVELYPHYPNTPSWRGAQLKQADSFIRAICRVYSILLDLITQRKVQVGKLLITQFSPAYSYFLSLRSKEI
jgi:hypothetical protein